MYILVSSINESLKSFAEMIDANFMEFTKFIIEYRHENRKLRQTIKDLKERVIILELTNSSYRAKKEKLEEIDERIKITEMLLVLKRELLD